MKQTALAGTGWFILLPTKNLMVLQPKTSKKVMFRGEGVSRYEVVSISLEPTFDGEGIVWIRVDDEEKPQPVFLRHPDSDIPIYLDDGEQQIENLTFRHGECRLLSVSGLSERERNDLTSLLLQEGWSPTPTVGQHNWLIYKLEGTE